MRAGKLRMPIQYQEPIYGSTSLTSSKLVGWKTVLSCFAALGTLSVREALIAGQTTALSTRTVTMRYPGFSLKETGRIVYTDLAGVTRYLQITGQSNVDERSRELEVTAIEKKFPPAETS